MRNCSDFNNFIRHCYIKFPSLLISPLLAVAICKIYHTNATHDVFVLAAQQAREGRGQRGELADEPAEDVPRVPALGHPPRRPLHHQPQVHAHGLPTGAARTGTTTSILLPGFVLATNPYFG